MQQQREENGTKGRNRAGISVAIAFVIIVLIVLISKGGNRKTFESESQMQFELQGTYTYYENGEAERQIEILGGQFRYVYRLLGEWNWYGIRWFPEKGMFKASNSTVIVTKNGDLKADGDLYKKGGYMSKKDSYSNSSLNTSIGSSGNLTTDKPTENAYDVLKFSNLEIESNSSYKVCTGSLSNTGKKTYNFVKVKGIFKDSAGTVVDTDWTYVVGSEGIEPGETKTFRLSVPMNTKIDSCSVQVFEYK